MHTKNSLHHHATTKAKFLGVDTIFFIEPWRKYSVQTAGAVGVNGAAFSDTVPPCMGFNAIKY